MHVDDALRRSIETWRAPVPVRAAWRDALLRDIAAAAPPSVEPVEPDSRATRRLWMLRPVTVLAAASVILTIGLTSGLYLSRRAGTGVTAAPNASIGLTTVRFVIVAPSARNVSLVGDFNRWDVSANPMRASGDGQTWVLELPLSPGRHTYAFVVDGDVLRDAAAPTLVDDDFGVRNSVIFVGDGRT